MRKLRRRRVRRLQKVGGGIGWPSQAPPPARSSPGPVCARLGLREAPASLRSARGLVQRGCVAGQGHTAPGSGGPAPPGPPPGSLVRGPADPRAHLAHPAAPGGIAPAGPEPGRAAAHRRRPSSLHPGAGSAPPPWNSDPARKGRGRALKGNAPLSVLRPQGSVAVLRTFELEPRTLPGSRVSRGASPGYIRVRTLSVILPPRQWPSGNDRGQGLHSHLRPWWTSAGQITRRPSSWMSQGQGR